MITLRQSKGSPLTYTELDGNFSQLDTKTKDGWADIVAELYTRTSPQAAGVNLFRNGIYLYEFDAAELREAFSNFHIPHAWKPGTMVYPHMHYSVNTASSGVVRWGFEYTLARRNDSTGQTAFPATTTIYVEQTIAANSDHTHFVCEAAEGNGIPGTNLEVDAMILMRVFRDAEHVNDTFPDSAFGITVDLHIEVDRASTPNRAPDFYA
jgi:hypothetical protein